MHFSPTQSRPVLRPSVTVGNIVSTIASPDVVVVAPGFFVVTVPPITDVLPSMTVGTTGYSIRSGSGGYALRLQDSKHMH